ncbi:S26 family signal peptidase [Oscillibacter sp.]|uniref:S26 family signal peptidase n=1 Tax=Oscillibacter sp. TaxID=1945593 RepID=UPI00338F7BB5
MGDNRNHSSDSRSSDLGTVDTRYVIGKAVFLLFPARTRPPGNGTSAASAPLRGSTEPRGQLPEKN